MSFGLQTPFQLYFIDTSIYFHYFSIVKA